MGIQKKNKRKLPPHTKVWFRGLHRKKLVQYYANLHGMSDSAFFNYIFNEWQKINGR